MNMLFNVHLVCVGVRMMCDVPGLYSCARGDGLSNKLKRSAVAIAPDSMLSGYGLGCFLIQIRSANQMPVRPPFETQFRGRALMAIAE